MGGCPSRFPPFRATAFDDLLNPPGSEATGTFRLEEVPPRPVAEVELELLSEVLGEEDDTILAALALVHPDGAPKEVHIGHLDVVSVKLVAPTGFGSQASFVEIGFEGLATAARSS